jgi:molybdate transport system substrate-binding protein
VSGGRTPAARVLAALCFALALAAGPAGAAPPRTELAVFAAASLNDAFKDIAQRFSASHPGVHVQLNLAGSQQLALQIEQGAAADVFASADERWSGELAKRELLADSAAVFAHNRLIVVVPKTNPARIGHLQDLAKGGVKVVIAADQVPVGHYTRDVLAKLAHQPGFDASYSRRVLANVVSEEENVKSVLSKVQLGEADAGFVYVSDVTTSLSHFVHSIAIPDSANVLASYPIATVKGARQPELARAFVALVLSPEGQQALVRHGLIAAHPSAP